MAPPVAPADVAPSPAWALAASRCSHPAAGGGDWVWDVATGLARVTVPWELRPGVLPRTRTWELVLSSPSYEVWAICWPPGARLDLHDHGGSAGAFCVVSGSLVESVPGPGGLVHHRWAAGEGARFGPDHVHAVANDGTEVATSVHVYTPGLSAMTFHDGPTVSG